jgi:hypothetical protein
MGTLHLKSEPFSQKSKTKHEVEVSHYPLKFETAKVTQIQRVMWLTIGVTFSFPLYSSFCFPFWDFGFFVAEITRSRDSTLIYTLVITLLYIYRETRLGRVGSENGGPRD